MVNTGIVEAERQPVPSNGSLCADKRMGLILASRNKKGHEGRAVTRRAPSCLSSIPRKA